MAGDLANPDHLAKARAGLARKVASEPRMEGTIVPLYIDSHEKVPGLTAEAVAGAHQKDLELQSQHGVNYIKYWYNEAEEKVFCLVEAPSKEAANCVHREAHGLVADQLVEVTEGC
jgi:hypothetical protein